uniref:TNF receptor associated factor 4 n=1 Tax=Chrysemys picta bellii TaxID=8478 RepID=A0A8C3PAS2_CHRPI
MPGFDYKFLEKPKRRLLCPLCGKAMREPVQVSTCGHRFCDTCVFKCPEDQLPLDYAKTFNPDPNWKNFQKPGTSRSSLDESTLGFGYPKFISHEDIKKRNYVRDNTVFIKASVEIPPRILA